MITDESLIFSNQRFSSFSKMDEYLKSYKAPLDDELEVFEFKKIIEYKYYEDGSLLKVKRFDSFNKKEFSLKVSTKDLTSLKRIAEKLKSGFNFSETQINSSKWKSIKNHTIDFTFSLLLSSFFVWIAYSMHNGEQIEVNKGRNYGMIKSFLALVDFIGPYGVLLIGIGICSLDGYGIYKNFNKPIILYILSK